jgi:hypothetical protein
MIAWIRPVSYAVAYEGVPPRFTIGSQLPGVRATVAEERHRAADRGIIMNKENSYEFGLEDETGGLQGAFSPCWRWWGTRRIPVHGKRATAAARVCFSSQLTAT